MIRIAVLSVLATLPLLTAPSAPAQPPLQPAAPPCANPWVNDPLVVYAITQGTLVGFIDDTLIVDAAGSARRVRSTLDGAGSKAVVVQIGVDAARQLHIALSQAGAGVVCDGPASPIPTPRKSLTLLREGTDTRGHNASWLVAQPEHQALEQVLDSFIAAHFPGF
ncbi:MAG: hypothetical protein JNL28_07710 [Planctomycetes bacterium]|nr:hypothetical protein [Planctomycetota bacterium]